MINPDYRHPAHIEAAIIESFRTSTVAAVSNSDALLGQGFGAEIDTHDLVVRFNKFGFGGYAADIGTKTNVYCCHFKARHCTQNLDPHRIEHCFICTNVGEAPPDDWRTMFKARTVTLLNREKITDKITLTTGMTMLDWLIKTGKPKKLSLYGFTGSSSGHYYCVSQKMSGDHNIKFEARLLSEMAASRPEIIIK